MSIQQCIELYEEVKPTSKDFSTADDLNAEKFSNISQSVRVSLANVFHSCQFHQRSASEAAVKGSQNVR
jgi:hypothetical protein